MGICASGPDFTEESAIAVTSEAEAVARAQLLEGEIRTSDRDLEMSATVAAAPDMGAEAKGTASPSTADPTVPPHEQGCASLPMGSTFGALEGDDDERAAGTSAGTAVDCGTFAEEQATALAMPQDAADAPEEEEEGADATEDAEEPAARARAAGVESEASAADGGEGIDNGLPAGWEAKAHDGNVYYENVESGEKQWSHPSMNVAGAPLPAGWEARQHEGNAYYENVETGETRWERPSPLPPLPTGWEASEHDGNAYSENVTTDEKRRERPSPSPSPAVDVSAADEDGNAVAEDAAVADDDAQPPVAPAGKPTYVLPPFEFGNAPPAPPTFAPFEFGNAPPAPPSFI